MIYLLLYVLNFRHLSLSKLKEINIIIDIKQYCLYLWRRKIKCQTRIKQDEVDIPERRNHLSV